MQFMKSSRLWLVGCLGLLLASPSMTFSAPGPSKVLIYDSRKGNLGAQFKSIMNDLLPVIGQRIGHPLTLDYVTERPQFFKDIVSPEVKLVHTMESEQMSVLAGKGYEPLVSVALFGSTDDNYCVYVNKTSSMKSLQDLKGKLVMGYLNPVSYFVLRKVLGVKPEAFFAAYKPSRSGQDSLYALSLGQVEAAISTKTNIYYLQIANPGPLKKIRQLTCLNYSNVIPPILVRREFPKDLKVKILKFMKNFRQEPAMKKYMGMFSMLRLEFKDPPAQILKMTTDLEIEAKKKGWDKDHAIWLKQSPLAN